MSNKRTIAITGLLNLAAIYELKNLSCIKTGFFNKLLIAVSLFFIHNVEQFHIEDECGTRTDLGTGRRVITISQF